jgi:threonine/homoserine/homoserine lactone efflux protein
VGLAGGAFLVYLGIDMLRQIGRDGDSAGPVRASGPVITGIVLSATNPYFLLWWATVGLNLAYRARGFGWAAVAVFAGVHWLCDLVWLSILSLGAHAGSRIMKGRGRWVVSFFCGAAIAAFGLMFICDGLKTVIL